MCMLPMAPSGSTPVLAAPGSLWWWPSDHSLHVSIKVYTTINLLVVMVLEAVVVVVVMGLFCCNKFSMACSLN